jgi:hypothetical protein
VGWSEALELQALVLAQPGLLTVPVAVVAASQRLDGYQRSARAHLPAPR